METDLECVIKNADIVLPPADVKSYMQMLLRGVEHCHKNWVLHRVSAAGTPVKAYHVYSCRI